MYSPQSTVCSYESFIHEATVGTVHSAQSAVIVLHKEVEKRKKGKGKISAHNEK
jgi:hypothetical protein